MTRDDMKDIIDIELAHVRERLRDRGLELMLTEEARELLVEKGYSPEEGARPLKRAIEGLLEDPISEEILKGRFESVDTLTVRVKDKHMEFVPSVEKEKEEPEEVTASSDC